MRVVDEDGEMVGILATHEAMALAEEKGLDLVEVATNSKPPVCRIMDYGKFKYEQSKRAKKAKQKQHVTHLKEVKLRPKIEKHDYQFKLRNAIRFLEGRDKVKVTVIFRGRELAHIDLGRKILDGFVADLTDVANVEVPPKMEGRNMSLVLSPKPVKVEKQPKAADGEKKADPAGREVTADERE